MEIIWIRFATTAVFASATLLAVLPAKEANAEPGLRLGLGRTVFNSWATWGEVGYELPGGWELAASITASGNTRNGHQGEVKAVSFSRIFRPQWHLFGATSYFRLGVAHADGSALVGDNNFRLGLGLEWSAVQVEYFHYSSARLSKPNTGIDGVQLRFAY